MSVVTDFHEAGNRFMEAINQAADMWDDNVSVHAARVAFCALMEASFHSDPKFLQEAADVLVQVKDKYNPDEWPEVVGR